MNLHLKLTPPTPSPVLDTYWRFAAARMKVYYLMLEGEEPPFTDDPILAKYRFTNCYRASDRVSQYLLRNVIYHGTREPLDTFFRVLLFKIFNRVETWERLCGKFGEPSLANFSISEYGKALEIGRGAVYSAAYIMPTPPYDFPRKTDNHLAMLAEMVLRSDSIGKRALEARSLENLFKILRVVPSIGDFLAFQYAIDLNYTPHFDFYENDYVVAGPGALRGLTKCFTSPGDYEPADIIRWVTDRQETELARVGCYMDFVPLFGRRLHLIDCQNLFCETDKYARVAHPELASERTKIKQSYTPNTLSMPKPFFPPKWGINAEVERRFAWKSSGLR